MELTLEQWFAELDQHEKAIPLEILTRDLPRLRVDFEAVERFAQFSPERYRRNLMHSGPAYHALVLCWRAGQVSPIHDHRGSAWAVRVIRGECHRSKGSAEKSVVIVCGVWISGFASALRRGTLGDLPSG